MIKWYENGDEVVYYGQNEDMSEDEVYTIVDDTFESFVIVESKNRNVFNVLTSNLEKLSDKRKRILSELLCE